MMSDWVLLERKVNLLYFARFVKKMFLFFRIHQLCTIKLRIILRILLISSVFNGNKSKAHNS